MAPLGLGPLLDQLVPLFLLSGLCAAMWLVIRSWPRHAPPSSGDQRPIGKAEGVACDRYARGEITREQFWQILDDLHQCGQEHAPSAEKRR